MLNTDIMLSIIQDNYNLNECTISDSKSSSSLPNTLEESFEKVSSLLIEEANNQGNATADLLECDFNQDPKEIYITEESDNINYQPLQSQITYQENTNLIYLQNQIHSIELQSSILKLTSYVISKYCFNNSFNTS